MIPAPVLTPWLSSLWLGLVTPVYARIGKQLIESIRHETLVTTDAAERLFSVHPRGVKEAIQRALENEDNEIAATRWSDARSTREPPSWGGVRFGSRLIDRRRITIRRSPPEVFARVESLGGRTGWYSPSWLWRLRGLLDLALGGAGMRRGRRHPQRLAVGDTVDFWRVEGYEEDRLLRLAAEMKLPGRASLQFEVEPFEAGSVLTQTAIFDPVGLPGLIYWYLLWPAHSLIFGRMLRGIARASEDAAGPVDLGRVSPD
jgi:hypothetical protein